VDQISRLLDDALGRRIASAVAVSIGDGGREVGRLVRGHTRRLPTLGEPVSDETWFDLASVTKPIAAAASAMVLVGEGRLSLGDPIRRWLPDASSTGTVGDLLGHGAGCLAHVEFFRELAKGSAETGIADPRAELVRRAAREPAGPPNAAAVYSDLGYIMVGAIVERAAGAPLEDAFAELVAGPLGLGARYAAPGPLAGAVATELSDAHGLGRGLVCGIVHDENAAYGGRVCGHAGLFARIGDVARFAAAIVDTAAGAPRGRLRTEVVRRFATTAPVPGATWRLGWDTPSEAPGVSHAGDRWPRTGALGHSGFTGTSLWLDLPRRRWVALLTNRVHPTRHGGSAEAIKALRRAVNDAALDLLENARPH
jgi:CubicO group peptidase (beta-lactamase class C family)